MNLAENIILGVVSGIATSAVIYILVHVFNQIVLPWYRSLVYRGVHVDGTWEEELDFENGNTQQMTVELDQKASTIIGSATMVKSTNGEIVSTKILSLDGTVKDRLFCSTLTPVDKKQIGVISILLEVVGDGSTMRGSTSWYDASAANIIAKKTQWARK